MATHGKIGEFDTTLESWDTYIERLELYFVANGITEAERKRAVLLTVWALDVQVNPELDSPTKTR